MNENDFQRAVIEAAHVYGWRVFHVTDSRREVIDRKRGISYMVGDQLARGWPDLALAHPRHRHFAVRELKTDARSSRVTPDQRRWLELLTLCGVDAGVWRPRDWHSIVAYLKNPKTQRHTEVDAA